MALRRMGYLLALAGVFVFYIAYQQWLAWILLLTVAALPWLSLLVSLPGILCFRVQAFAADHVPMGGVCQAGLRAKSRFLIPGYQGRIRLRRITTGETWECNHSADVPTEHCGGIEVIPYKIYVQDLMGLFRFRTAAPRPCRVVVLPREVPPAEPPELSRFQPRIWKPKTGGGYGENHELRLYRPGDSLNQIHWKLTAKTGKFTIREPLEPQRGLVLLTLDLRGTPQELDRKFGRLLWLGNFLNQQAVPFRVDALTGGGLLSFPVTGEEELRRCLLRLLCEPPAAQGSAAEKGSAASWHYHIGGEPDAQ